MDRRLRLITWKDYGITKKRYDKLKQMCQRGKCENEIQAVAYTMNQDIAPYILLSVKYNKSYDDIEYTQELGRIPCGRTDFYGYRRYFYHLLDKKLAENL